MPKTRDWKGLVLLRYCGTDLYQWFGKQNGSVFEDQASEPFVIEPVSAAPAPDAWRYPVLTARGEAIERMARAMWNSKAWPSASGNAKAAEQLAEDALTALEAAAPAPDEMRESVWQAVMGGGDAWGITDRVIALLAAAPAPDEMREGIARFVQGGDGWSYDGDMVHPESLAAADAIIAFLAGGEGR
jgi:hypothetical protein